MFMMIISIYPDFKMVLQMDVGPGHNIPNSVVLVLHDTIIQLGQVAMEINACGSK